MCARGQGQKKALIWEGFGGKRKDYTFDDMRVLTNAFAVMLQEQGLEPGDRVCVFMDKIPSLYFSFLQNEAASPPGGEIVTSYHPGNGGVCQFKRQLKSESE